MTTCSKSCDGCDYRGSIGGKGSARTCDYILITGHRRGCPAGSRCAKKRVGGVVVKGIAADIAEDVRTVARKARRPGSGCTSEASKLAWARKLADPAYQMALIRKWEQMDDTQLRKVIAGKREWRRKWEAEHGAET